MASIADRARALQALPTLPPGQPAAPTEEAEQQGIPRPRGIPPEPPRHMSDEARAIWDQTLEEMQHLGIVDRLDRWALVRYCSNVIRWQKLDEKLQEVESFTITYESGAEQVSGLWTACKQVEATLLSLESELGLTPASRARLMFASYGGRVLANPKADTKRGLRGAYNKGGKSK